MALGSTSSGPSPLWYATRSTGEVALLLLTVVLVLGVVAAVRFGGRRVPRFVISGLHRNLTLVTLGFLALHIVTSVADTYAPLSWWDVVVPFGSAYRPTWVGLGAISFDLLAALTVTSLVRTRLGLRTWRILHWSAYACWPLALVHALGTGSDSRTTLFLLLTGACGAVALVAVGWRLAAAGPGNTGLRTAAAVGTVVLVLLVAAWSVQGPLASGWARRAGTPVQLLKGGHS